LFLDFDVAIHFKVDGRVSGPYYFSKKGPKAVFNIFLFFYHILMQFFIGFPVARPFSTVSTVFYINRIAFEI